MRNIGRALKTGGGERLKSEREKNRTVRVMSEHSGECARARKRERAEMVGGKGERVRGKGLLGSPFSVSAEAR